MLIYLTPLLSLLESKLLYLDPGTGSMLLQMAIAAILGLAVLVRMQWTRIKKLFGKKTDETDGEDEKDE
jgi:positive regulator of sigma E activity